MTDRPDNVVPLEGELPEGDPAPIVLPTPEQPAVEAEEATLERLASLPTLEFARVKKAEAERLGINVTDLDVNQQVSQDVVHSVLSM